MIKLDFLSSYRRLNIVERELHVVR